MTMKKPCGVILSAGKGSRIDPFNTQYPKPLLPIADRPIMGHHIDVFRSLGITDVKIVVGHLMNSIVNYFGRGQDFGVNIEYVEQESTLGIAHAVGKVADLVDGPFLLVLGDIFYAPIKIESMIEQFNEQGGGAVLAVMCEPDEARLKKNFSVELGPDGMVTRVVEKPSMVQNDLKGCGIYMFGGEIFDAIRKTPRTAMRDEYEITSSIQILIDDGHPVSTAEVIAWDHNITFPEDLLLGNLEYLKQQGLSEVISESAQIHDDCVIRNSVIGDDVHITEAATITRSVVLSGSRIDRAVEITDTIVSPNNWFQC